MEGLLRELLYNSKMIPFKENGLNSWTVANPMATSQLMLTIVPKVSI